MVNFSSQFSSISVLNRYIPSLMKYHHVQFNKWFSSKMWQYCSYFLILIFITSSAAVQNLPESVQQDVTRWFLDPLNRGPKKYIVCEVSSYTLSVTARWLTDRTVLLVESSTDGSKMAVVTISVLDTDSCSVY